MMNQQTRERLRRSFLPQSVRILFVGESPPASGRFFYCRDSGLYRAMRELFQVADSSIRDEMFLHNFKSSGCYLIDLCGEPVDKLTIKERCAAHLAGERALSKQIRRLQPEVIVSLVRSTCISIARAAGGAHWQGSIVDVPYPGRWIAHKRVFTARLLPLVQQMLHQRADSQ